MSFDPALIHWEPPPPNGFGPGLHYGGELSFPCAALDGLRYKYPFKDLGFIVKAEVMPRAYLDYRAGQGQSEWEVWDSLPEDLRPYFVPLLCHAWSPIGDHAVIWTAQEWCHGRPCVTRKECNRVEQVVRKAGYKLYDNGPRQMMRTPEGAVLVDWGHWVPPRNRH